MSEDDLVNQLRDWADERAVPSSPSDLLLGVQLMREAAAEITRLRWRPIETAPKDGTRILGYVKGVCIELWWHQDMHYAAHWMDEGDSEPEPTHWMPLPTQPEDK